MLQNSGTAAEKKMNPSDVSRYSKSMYEIFIFLNQFFPKKSRSEHCVKTLLCKLVIDVERFFVHTKCFF